MVLKPSTCAVFDLWCLMISQLIFDIFFDEKNYVKIVGLLLHVPKITCISLGHIRYVHSKKFLVLKRVPTFSFSFSYLFRFLVLLWIRYHLIRIIVRQVKIKSFTGVHLTSFFSWENCRWDAGKIKVVLNLRNFQKEPINPGSHRLFSFISLFTNNFLSLIKNFRVFFKSHLI